MLMLYDDSGQRHSCHYLWICMVWTKQKWTGLIGNVILYLSVWNESVIGYPQNQIWPQTTTLAYLTWHFSLLPSLLLPFYQFILNSSILYYLISNMHTYSSTLEYTFLTIDIISGLPLHWTYIYHMSQKDKSLIYEIKLYLQIL